MSRIDRLFGSAFAGAAAVTLAATFTGPAQAATV